MTAATLGQVALRQGVLARPLVSRCAVRGQGAAARTRALHLTAQGGRNTSGLSSAVAAGSGALNMTADTPSPQYSALLGKQASAAVSVLQMLLLETSHSL